jgi:anti-sigma-K factor RskA
MTAKNREELLNLIPAYALEALDDHERAEVEAWLQHDAEAQAILADYRAAANALVALAPYRPAPAHLQDDLRRRLAVESNQPFAANPITPGTARRSPQRFRRAWLMAAALLVMILFGLVIMRFSTDDTSSTLSAKELYVQLQTQSGARQYDLVPGEVDQAVWGNLLISANGTQGVLCMWKLPRIANDQTFQMWLIDTSGARTSGGLFRAAMSEDALYVQVRFERPPTTYQSVGVSLEPAGGSPYPNRPSGPRVLSVPLTEGGFSPNY